jgi:DNA-binding HxlR family transcriptional regulator
LLDHKIVTQVSAGGGSRHLAYQLTGKGRALLPALKAVRDWGLAWEKGTRALMTG